MIGIKRIAKAFRSIIAIILAGTVMIIGAAPAQADLDILIVGSTHSFSEGGESGVIHEEPFNPSSIATELQSILASDPAIVETVNVVFDDVYKSEARYVQTSKSGWTTWDFRCYSLAQHYAWPTGITNRHADLRGENGTAWDYVVIMEDPYVMANFPGMFAEGADMLVKEVRSGTAEPILFAQWPENGSIYSASNFNEVVYRVGESAGVKVVPGGKGWDSLSPQDSSTSHPTPDGAYLAAASIYSELFDRSAKTSGYIYDDAIADHALSTVETNEVLPQFSGAFTNLTVFTMKYVDKRLVSYRETGSSTEKALEDALLRLDARCGVTFTPTATHDPTDWDFNYGRGNDWWEASKQYHMWPSVYDRSYGFPMHYYGMENAISHMAYGIDKKFYGGSYNDGTDLGIAYNMIRPGTREPSLPADVRCIPIRLLYVKMLEYSPTMNPLHDGTHMHFNLNDASAAFMYALLSGRCPLVDEPSPVNYSESSDWMRWMGNKVGYETAWRMAHVTTRVPGFQVLPASTNENITPSTPTTLSVRFWYAPTSDVTVAVSTDDSYIGVVTPTSLTFTASNYTNAQTVTVIGQTGSAGTHEFNVSLTTSSGDISFDGLQDTWSYDNIRPEGPLPSDIKVYGNGSLVENGDMSPELGEGAHLGLLSGPGSRTFTITNESSFSSVVDLTNSPRVTLIDPSGCFSLTNDATLGSVTNGGGVASFEIACDPVSPGLHTALVSIASTDWAVPDYRFSVAAILADSPPAVSNDAAVATGPTTATLSGMLTAGGGGEAWICWGCSDAGTDSTGDWDNVVSIGSVLQGTPFSAEASGLATNTTYWYRPYVTNGLGTAWADSAETFSGTPAGGAGGVPVTSGLKLWLDASDVSTLFQDSGGTTPITADGQTVGRWNDKSAAGNDASQGNASQEPAYITNGFNTLPALHFQEDCITSTFNADAPDITLFIVYQRVAANDGLWGHDNGGWDRLQIFDNNGPWNYGRGGSAVQISGLGNTDTNIYAVLSEGGVANGCTVYVNRDTTTTFTDNNSDGEDSITFGAINSSGAYAANNVKIAEILVYGRVLSSNDHESVGGYLADKYGLSTAYPDVATIANFAPTGVFNSVAMFNASLDASGTNNDVYVYYGTSDGGTNAASWTSSDYVGSWTNVSTNVSYAASSLTAGQTYYYTFMASNATTVSWASPSWQFATLGSQAVTTNYSVPHAWLAGINPAWTNDYEAAATNDYDNDGFSTWQEYWSGTDPMNGNSFLKIDAVLYDGSNVIIEWQHDSVDAAIPPIGIEVSADLTGTWVDVDYQMPSNGLNSWIDVNSTKRFYRLSATHAP